MEYLVQADTAAKLKTTLIRHDTGEAIPLTGHTTNLRVRQRGTTTVLFTIAGIEGGDDEYLDGIVTFPFGTNLDTLVGFYEGEIEITYANTTIESVYEIIKFQIREDF
jgi:hypothetical protein